MIPWSFVNGLSPSFMVNVRCSCVSIDSAAVSQVVCVLLYFWPMLMERLFYNSQWNVHASWLHELNWFKGGKKNKVFSKESKPAQCHVHPHHESPCKKTECDKTFDLCKMCEKLVTYLLRSLYILTECCEIKIIIQFICCAHNQISCRLYVWRWVSISEMWSINKCSQMFSKRGHITYI